MSNRNGRVRPELSAEGQYINVTKPSKRLAGFVVQELVGDGDDYCRGSVFTMVKQPGQSHPIIATEQYVTTYDGIPYYDGQPKAVDIAYARSQMDQSFRSPEANLPALLIIEQLKRS